MHPDDLPLCGYCGLDEITHDETSDHFFNAVGGGRVGALSRKVEPSNLRRNGLRIVLLGWACWVVVFLCLYYLGRPRQEIAMPTPAQAVHFDGLQVRDGVKESYTISVGTGGTVRSTCCAEGACWNASKNGMCFLADKPR